MGGGGGRAPRHLESFVEGKLFLGGVDPSSTAASITAYCEQWGPVADAVTMSGKGFGFVTFQDAEHAMQFLEQRVHTIDNKQVRPVTSSAKAATSN